MNEIEWRREEALAKKEEARLALMPRPVLPEIDFDLLRKVDPEFYNVTKGRKVNFGDTTSKHSLDKSSQNKQETEKRRDLGLSVEKREKSLSYRSRDESSQSKPKSISSLEKSSRRLSKLSLKQV